MIIEFMHPPNGLFKNEKIFYKFCAFFVLISYGFSLPEGTIAVQGDGNDVQTVGSEMIITASDNSIFEHQSFYVAPNETVRFVQPSIESRVLNRVVGAGAKSSIQGNIIANGSVYLVNPAGVVFGSGSSVNVGRLHVVAGSLSNENFNAGTDTFTNLTGEVRNQGVINATSVSFAGALVVNSGQIYAPGGYVVLAQGDEGNNLSSSSGSSVYNGQSTSSVELVDSNGLLSVSVGSETKTASTMIADLGAMLFFKPESSRRHELKSMAERCKPMDQSKEMLFVWCQESLLIKVIQRVKLIRRSFIWNRERKLMWKQLWFHLKIGHKFQDIVQQLQMLIYYLLPIKYLRFWHRFLFQDRRSKCIGYGSENGNFVHKYIFWKLTG